MLGLGIGVLECGVRQREIHRAAAGRLRVVQRGGQCADRPGLNPIIVPTSAVVTDMCGSWSTIAIIVGKTSVSPLNLIRLPPWPTLAFVTRVMLVEANDTDDQLILLSLRTFH